MLNRFKIDVFFLSNICLTSAEELLNLQSFHGKRSVKAVLSA